MKLTGKKNVNPNDGTHEYAVKDMQDIFECKDCKHFELPEDNTKKAISCTLFDCNVPANDHICGVFRPIIY